LIRSRPEGAQPGGGIRYHGSTAWVVGCGASAAQREAGVDGNRVDDTAQRSANDEACPAARLARMEAEHRALDVRIDELQSRVYQDQLQLQRMKKRKLYLRDAMARLRTLLIPDLDA